MFVAVYPSNPSSALAAALLDAGYQPVPIEQVDEIEIRTPDQGWAAAVVEIVEDLGRGLAMAAKITEEHDLPLLVVIDRTMTLDITDADGYGDFLLTPIDRTELRVRLARLQGSGAISNAEEIVRYRDLGLNTATYQAIVGGEPRDLTFMEYELLRFFVENRGRVWSREQILSKVWGYDYFGGSRTVDVHVRRLRAKLGEERSSWITTVRSVGYRFG